jgi:hypothetical protein
MTKKSLLWSPAANRISPVSTERTRQLAEPRPLILVQARECPVAVDGFGHACADRLRLADHRFAFSSFAGTICAS